MDESMADDMMAILDRLPKQRKTLMFSATIGEEMDEVESLPGEKPFVYVGDSVYVAAVILPVKRCFSKLMFLLCLHTTLADVEMSVLFA